MSVPWFQYNFIYGHRNLSFPVLKDIPFKKKFQLIYIGKRKAYFLARIVKQEERWFHAL